MNQSETINELAVALAKAQATVSIAAKDKVNPHFKSKYADLGAVWDACRKPLTDNGLSIVQMPADVGEGRVGLTTMLLHSSGQFISSTVSTRLVKDDAQGVGSALTYLRRYALASFVGIVADEDDDGNAASQGATYQQRPQPQQPSRPQLPTEKANEAPKTSQEAEQRFYNAYGKVIALAVRCTPAQVGWKEVCEYMDWPTDEAPPTTIDQWMNAARAVKARQPQTAAA